MKSKIALLIMITIVLALLVLLFINAIKARQTERAWFIAGAALVIVVAWIVHFVRADFFTYR